jgi:RimJ/RimL family protein N-acetyltransferase/mannose-6-phosphate isomerase-like protein (cupin superfamily)
VKKSVQRIPIPSFDTSRLTMRGHTLEDFLHTLKLWSDPRVTHFIGQPQTPEESWGRLLRYMGHWASLDYGYWIVEEKHTGDFVGEVGFADYKRAIVPSLDDAPELGWVLSPEKSGCGYATEAAMGALAWARTHCSWQRVVCIIRPEHDASIRVALKCGFQKVSVAEYKNQATSIFEQFLCGTPTLENLERELGSTSSQSARDMMENGPISRDTAEHHVWGELCDGWRLLRSEGLSVIEERMPTGTAERRHVHNRAQQFFYVLSGELTLEVDGRETVLALGSGCKVLPGQPHQIFNRGERDAYFLVVSQPSSYVDRIDV